MSEGGNLGLVAIAVDGSEESMNALRWALQNLKLRSPTPDSTHAGCFLIFHVQSPPSIATGLNPGAIPFGGPSDLEVPAFAAAIEAHQKRITDSIFDYALGICSEFNLSVCFLFSYFFLLIAFPFAVTGICEKIAEIFRNCNLKMTKLIFFSFQFFEFKYCDKN